MNEEITEEERDALADKWERSQRIVIAILDAALLAPCSDDGDPMDCITFGIDLGVRIVIRGEYASGDVEFRRDGDEGWKIDFEVGWPSGRFNDPDSASKASADVVKIVGVADKIRSTLEVRALPLLNRGLDAMSVVRGSLREKADRRRVEKAER